MGRKNNKANTKRINTIAFENGIEVRSLLKSDRYYYHRFLRLPEYNDEQLGIYLVSLCSYQSQCLYGEIRPEIELAQWIIMTNH